MFQILCNSRGYVRCTTISLSYIVISMWWCTCWPKMNGFKQVLTIVVDTCIHNSAVSHVAGNNEIM